MRERLWIRTVPRSAILTPGLIPCWAEARRVVIKLSPKRQVPIAGYQGEPGAFSQSAARKLLGEAVKAAHIHHFARYLKSKVVGDHACRNSN